MIEDMETSIATKAKGTPVYRNDFFTGFIAALAQTNVHHIFNVQSIPFHKSVEAAYKVFNEAAADQNLDMRFLIIRNEFHGDSDDITEGMIAAASRGIISYVSPYYTTVNIRIPSDYTYKYLENVPGDNQNYIKAADTFLDNYSGVN